MPAALQAHLDSGVTTTCRLLRITLTSGLSFGMTTLDQDVVYQGVTYSCRERHGHIGDRHRFRPVRG